ncbi:MAG: hypothetical protein ACR2QK_07720 [Acidimicrobiales bacterium]
MAEGPAVAAVEAQYGDQVQFVGIGGQAQRESEFTRFIEGTGTGDFPQLEDISGELWQRFGTGGRSTFMFVNDDGSFELTSYGVVDEAELVEQVERLIAA